MDKEVLQKIGIMGGTFNPIHNGHLLIAESAREEFGLDKVLFIPTRHPPHKLNQQITEASHRCNMIELAIKDNPFFELNLIEVQEKRISYTYLTLQNLKKIHPKAELYFILGADSLYDLEKWRKPEEILASCNILAAYRWQEEAPDFQEQMMYLNEKYNAHIYPLHAPAFDVSSSNIRSRICKAESIRYLVPTKVADYIQKTKLYQNP